MVESLSGGFIERWNGLHKSHRQAAAANKKYLRAALSLMYTNNEEESKHCIHVSVSSHA